MAGDFGWNHAEGMLYKYDGSDWRRWGKARRWLADVRSTLRGTVVDRADLLNKRAAEGDQFLCAADQVVYIYNGTLATNDAVAEDLRADPLLPGQRFYLRSAESIVEWNGIALETVAKASDEDGLFFVVQGEGVAYKSEDKVWRHWGFVPTTEDFVMPRDWENQWANAAKMSGVVEFYEVGAAVTNYVPSGGADTDGDGLPDAWEIRYGLNHLDGGFGGTTASSVDLDGDGRLDYVYNIADFVNGAWGDPDNDGLNNRAEWLAGTNPFEFDTDGDGLGDHDSPPVGATYGSLYMDGDNIPDAWESLFPTACSPLRFDAHLDPDGDGWDNYSEYMAYYLTRSANVYSVTTNEDGNVSSNWVSGTGYSIPYCDPDDPRSYPKPQLTFRFKTDCPDVEEGTLRIFAYRNPDMDCPDAKTSYALETAIRDGNSLSLTDWMDGGHLWQGRTYFMAFVDENNDGQWNDPELLGFAEYMPEHMGWGEAVVDIALREKANGAIRFGWGGSSSSTNEAASSDYTIFVTRTGSLVYELARGGCSDNRKYVHEFDFRHATGVNFPMSTGALFGAYSWQIKSGTNVLASGLKTADYPTNLVAPSILSPVGTVLYANEKLRMALDRNTAQVQIQIVNAVSGATVCNVTQFAPYVDRTGHAEMDLPVVPGWGTFTNGQYRIQVRAFNPRFSVASGWINFAVNLQPPAAGGPGMISGRAYYRGWSTNATVVVEAFQGSGFDQRPVAKVRADRNYNYKLMGLPIGTYVVRAFHDLNLNGVLDVGEAWSLVKGAPATVGSINWVVATISKRGGLSTTAAVNPYASDYSAKAIQVKSAAELAGNNLIVHDADADSDGLPDIWEKTYASGSLTTMNVLTDMDNDGLSDLQEFRAGSNPTLVDTDGDGLTDAQEVLIYGSDPTKTDTDGDGLSDFEESVRGTNPKSTDTDGDGFSDGVESALGSDPNNAGSQPASDGTVAEPSVLKAVAGSDQLAVTFSVNLLTGTVVILEFEQNNDLSDGAGWVPSGIQRAITASGTYTNAVPDLDVDGILNVRIQTK